MPVTAQASKIYLKIDGVQGGSNAAGHQNEIPIDAFDIAVSNSPNSRPSNSSGGSASKPVFTDLSLKKHLDRSSPTLFEATASGRRFSKAALTVEKSDEDSYQYLKYCFRDVRITRFATALSQEDGLPTESLGMGYSAVVETYTEPGEGTGNEEDGPPPDNVFTGGWDLLRNRSIHSC